MAVEGGLAFMSHADKSINKDDIENALREVLDEMGVSEESIDLNAFVRSIVSIVNHISLGVRVNANSTVFASTIKTANFYGEILAKTIEKWFPDCCALTRESSIYNWQNWSEKQKAFKILLVKDCEAADLDKLYNTLSLFEQAGYNPTVILCTTDKVFERMRRYENNEYRLFYSLCGYKIIIQDKS